MRSRDFDREHLWHPYAPAMKGPPVNAAVRSCGSTVELEDGTRLIDGISSWWCAAYGHRPESVVQAVRAQAEKLPHIMFAGFTHGPAAELGERLLKLLPGGLEHLFYADSGSIAVECALKMALQYQRGCGRPGRTRMAALRGGYHGDTIGAMSVSDPGGMHAVFSGVLPEQFFAPRPSGRFGEAWREEDVAPMEELLRKHRDEIAGVIAEPVFKGANGMWFYHPQYLRELRRVCDELDMPLIFDEIATGFGRTGRLWASEYAGVVPDIMCVGKALTAGVMTLGCVAASGRIGKKVGTFLHGPTFMANPLACAAGAAAVALYGSRDWLKEVRRIEEGLRTGLEKYRTLPQVRDVRVLGAVGVLEMERIPEPEAVQRVVLEEGVWLRPYDRYIYAMPPFVVTEGELGKIAGAMGKLAVMA